MMKMLDQWLKNVVEEDNPQIKKENKMETYNGWRELWKKIQRWLYPSVLPTHTKKYY
jgi:hypothetical protein